MAHEITETDNLVLHKTSAWHGLGLVLDEALSPTEAAKLVFPWEVVQKPIFYRGINSAQHILESRRVNLRSDTGGELGDVSDNYQVVQPMEMAEFAEALADQKLVKVETAGSIKGGRRIWFLLKGDAFDIKDGDSIIPYCLLSNGFDGGSSFRITPTTIRVVCSNTLHAVIPHKDKGELHQSAIVIRHSGDIKERLEEAKRALANYSKSIETTRGVANTLANKELNSDEVRQYFLDCYQTLFGAIPSNPKDGFEERNRQRSISAFSSFSKRFDDEKAIAGTTAWCAFNAISGMIQHDKKSRGQSDEDRIERRADSNLFGLNSHRTHIAIQKAYRMALQSS